MDEARRHPTPESLIELRTPTAIAPAEDGSRAVFALHASAGARGGSVPCHLWFLDADDALLQLTAGAWSDAAPLWSPDGARLAFVSDRGMTGHALPYTLVPGEEPVLAASFRGSAEQVLWSADGERLLVRVADPGSYGMDWSARPVTGAEPEPDPRVRRPGDAWRRLYLVDL